MSGHFACLYHLCIMCIQCPQRSEEDTGSPGTGVTEDCEPLCGCSEPGSSARAAFHKPAFSAPSHSASYTPEPSLSRAVSFEERQREKTLESKGREASNRDPTAVQVGKC